MDGQGNAGGRGDKGMYGGGGGGAGGVGTDALTGNPVGGIGKASDITGSEVWYAGGGGGGRSDKSISGVTEGIAGGKGGGGSGGVGTDLKPTAGADYTGGGGGGTFANTTGSGEGGAAGGSGVVYIRISIAIEGNLDPPASDVKKVYTGGEQRSVEESFAYTITGSYIGTNVDTYVAHVVLKDGFEWSDPSAPKDITVTMNITNAYVTINSLSVKSWMKGTPKEALPSPKCDYTFSGEVAVTFTYGPAGGPYDITDISLLTEPGAYKVHAVVAGTPNLVGTDAWADFEIINGLGQFRDYVELTIDPYSGSNPSELTNFPYKVTLSENEAAGSEYPAGTLVGFLYANAGKRGADIVFADSDGYTVLPSVVDEDAWNTSGDSVVYVRVPRIGPAGRKIYLYWHLRDGQEAPDHKPSQVWSDWTPEQAAAVSQPAAAFDLVVRDGFKVEYWNVKPKMTKTMWDVSDPEKGALSPTGALVDGAAFTTTIVDAHTGIPLAALPQTDIGAYRVVFAFADPDEYEPFAYAIDFCITGDITFDDLKRGASSLTMSGRVMLANDDTAAGYEVADQSYWQERKVDDTTYEVFWTHEGEHAPLPGLPNIRDGVDHALCQSADGVTTNVLWRFYDVLFGNIYASDSDAATVKNFLPCSATQQPTSSKTGAVGSKTEAGNMALRNMVGAVVYSPCYTNGIGTIYFDAVNGWNNNRGVDKGGYYNFVVELATETIDGKPPTDENAYGDNGYGNDTWDGRLRDESWKPCQMTPLKRDGTPGFVLCDKTYTNSLDIAIGGTSSNFYRICVNVDCRTPCRFRIRRVSRDTDKNEDGYAYIMLDNVVVSYPRVVVQAEPYGWYDHNKTGKAVLGQEIATTVPFPKVGGNDIYGRANVTGDASAITNVDASAFVLLSRMHYRWRYLGQQLGEWKSVDLPPASDFVSPEPLSLPAEAGDVEFFFESFTAIPHYEYHDYSGANLGLGGLYTESQKMVTNTWQNTDVDAPAIAASGGVDWFFRLREGSTPWEKASVVVNGKATAMEVVGDNLWRGLVKVSEVGASGEVPFFFELYNKQTEGATSFASNTDQWYAQQSVTNVPGRGASSPSYAGGAKVLVDDVSGYLEFQLNDRSGVFSVGHAEYQDFNGWHDAQNELFVGSSVLTSGVSSVVMIETNANMQAWDLSVFTASDWDLPFKLSDYLDTGFPKGVEFITHRMPGNPEWGGELGQFVDAKLTASNIVVKKQDSGIAWQMRGESFGKVSYDKTTAAPGEKLLSGLDTVSFEARLGQSIGFNDFAVWAGDGTRTRSDYTFVFPAVMSIADGNDYSPGASMSIVGYYRAGRGCYEFRVERRGNDGLQLSLYKWLASGGEMTCTCIASQWFSGATMQHKMSASNPTQYVSGTGSIKIPYLYGMFISLGEDNGATTVIAGVGSAVYVPSDAFSGRAHYMICCIDNESTRHKSGTMGALSTNCKGIFMTPRVYDSRIPLASPITARATNTGIQKNFPMFKYYSIGNSGNTTTISFSGTRTNIDDTLEYEESDPWKETEWDCALGRAEPVVYQRNSTTIYRGLEPPKDLSQTVELHLKPRGGKADWQKYGEVSVSGYGWAEKSIVVRTNADVSVQLRAGPKSTDVVVHDIRQTSWNGDDISSAGSSSSDSDFIYTKANIVEEVFDGPGSTKVTNRYAKLQPARALSGLPLSIRGPILKGVGMVGFSYENVDPACELLVQVATNNVTGNLRGTGNYNESLLDVPSGEPEPFGYWITVTNYTAAALAGATSREFYFGWHDTIDNPLEGVMRIVVKTNVVEAAHAVAKSNPDYGAITITDFWVHDEPPLDSKSWIGWNLRTIGGGEDAEGRMYLPDVGSGLSAALNNSTTADIAGDPTEYTAMNPTIQSPTFGGDSCIGQVRFKVRLYTNEVASAKVFMYGASDGAASSWSEITNFTVTSTTYLGRDFSAIGERYKAIRLAVDGVIAASSENPNPERVLIDEVVVSEKAQASLAFVYARPFRNNLNEDVVVADILDRTEQPLADESWGVQAKLRVGDFDTDIDVERGFKVTFRYFVGDKPWGYANWSKAPGASVEVNLKQVGAAEDYVFRSTVSRPSTVVPAQRENGTVVQYMLTAKYYLKGSDIQQSENIAWGTADGWWNPEWYSPVDLNVENGGEFSPYTILETVAPGRAWINEVNYNDGSSVQNGGAASVTNQFVEIAIPRGVDMTGWRLNLTDMNHRFKTLAILGGKKEWPATKKAYGVSSGDYDLYVLQSPASEAAGGIRDPLTGNVVADATWVKESLQATLKDGTLQYDEPYQLELVRPSGIVEHQFTLGGTNEWRGTEYDEYASAFDATNLLAELDFEDPSAKRFYAGDDLARKEGGVVFSSLGVSGSAHGEEGGWSANMKFTPGSANEGQDELSGWVIRPNGGSCWVYAKVFGDCISQRIGSEAPSVDTFVVVNSGATTNIEYLLSRWYQIDALTVNGETNSAAAGAKNGYVLTLSNITNTTYVVATSGISSDLIDVGLDPVDPYTPAVMRWLEAGVANDQPFADPTGPIKLAKWKGLKPDDPESDLPLKEMYWYDIDPTEGNWWMRGGTVGIDGSPIYRKRVWNSMFTGYYTNRQIRVKIYLSNDVSKVVYAPYRMQGIGGEQSDKPDLYTGSWTSETFKVMVYLPNGLPNNKGFLPFRWFTFGPNSFEPKGSAKGEYTALVEIMDPFSSSLGVSYGWSKFGSLSDSLWYKWRIDESRQAMTAETLDKDSSYDNTAYEDWTPTP